MLRTALLCIVTISVAACGPAPDPALVRHDIVAPPPRLEYIRTGWASDSLIAFVADDHSTLDTLTSSAEVSYITVSPVKLGNLDGSLTLTVEPDGMAWRYMWRYRPSSSPAVSPSSSWLPLTLQEMNALADSIRPALGQPRARGIDTIPSVTSSTGQHC
jgi:hypothetical protein